MNCLVNIFIFICSFTFFYFQFWFFIRGWFAAVFEFKCKEEEGILEELEEATRRQQSQHRHRLRHRDRDRLELRDRDRHRHIQCSTVIHSQVHLVHGRFENRTFDRGKEDDEEKIDKCSNSCVTRLLGADSNSAEMIANDNSNRSLDHDNSLDLDKEQQIADEKQTSQVLQDIIEYRCCKERRIDFNCDVNEFVDDKVEFGNNNYLLVNFLKIEVDDDGNDNFKEDSNDSEVYLKFHYSAPASLWESDSLFM